MGKLRYDPKHDCYHPHNRSLKVMIQNPKKSVKITYISSPLLVRACHASEFRSVVQQLTGKDSNDEIPHNKVSLQDSPPCRVMQGQGGDHLRPTEHEAGNALFHYNRSMNPLEFDEDCFWKEVAHSIFQYSPCVLV